MDRPVKRRGVPARVRWIALALTIGIAVALVAVLLPERGTVVVDAAMIETGMVTRAQFHDDLPLRAEIAPLHSVVVSAVAGGTVGTLDTADGALVAKGAALARLDNPTLQLDVTAREVEIASRLTDLSAQELALRRNQSDVETMTATAANEALRADHDLATHQTLFDKGIIAPNAMVAYQRDAAFRRDRLAALERSEAAEQATAGVQAARLRETRALLLANLADVRGELRALVVRAPASGRLTGFALQPGQAVKAGDPLGQVDSADAYKLIADVDEFYLGRLAPGQRAAATIDGTDAALTVDRVLPQVVNGRFKTELVFAAAPPAGLRRGQAVDVRIELGGARDALVAPNGAWLDAGGTTAFVVAAGGRQAARRAITIGRHTPEQVEITGGLHAGERIVTSGLAAYRTQTSLILREGSPS